MRRPLVPFAARTHTTLPSVRVVEEGAEGNPSEGAASEGTSPEGAATEGDKKGEITGSTIICRYDRFVDTMSGLPPDAARRCDDDVFFTGC